MSKNKQVKPHGEIRRSQLITTFGPGSMVDLPEHSVIVGGLNVWKRKRQSLIDEPRLAYKVKESLKNFGLIDQTCSEISLYAPPTAESDSEAGSGIDVFLFPRWFVAQVPNSTVTRDGRDYQSRPLVPYSQLKKGKYEDRNGKKHLAVPVRFVQGCSRGHLSDINWHRYVHSTNNKNCPLDLSLEEGGTGNDFSDIFVRCNICGHPRPLSQATLKDTRTLGDCNGDMPWLGFNRRETCEAAGQNRRERNRLLVRSASNAYFPQVLSAISIPDANQGIRDAVTGVYPLLMKVKDPSQVGLLRGLQDELAEALRGFSDENIFTEVERRRNNASDGSDRSLKQVEIEALLTDKETFGTDDFESNFYAERRTLADLDPAFAGKLERVVLVHRLREVTATIGFTRFEPIGLNINGELPGEMEVEELGVRPARMDFEMKWVPAIENKGEGVFISFNAAEIEKWSKRAEVKQRGEVLLKGFEAWCDRREVKTDAAGGFPGLPYIMLHTLSHLLISTVALTCGYSASAIKERVYAGSSGYGILLYTGTTGSEGTLGGLIEVGRSIEKYILQALESGKLCSNDPICSLHEPTDRHVERFLHGAACHGCVLIAETSCEQRNEFLDRALVVETVEGHGAAFFQ